MVKTVKTIDPKPAPGSYASLAAQYARAKAQKAEEEREKREGKKVVAERPKKDNRDELNEIKRGSFRRAWWGVTGWWTWVL